VDVAEGRQPPANYVQNLIDTLAAIPARQAINLLPDHTGTSILGLSSRTVREPSKNPVLDIVIKQFPIPSDDTPLEAVLDFRSDRAARDALRRLRRWMQKIATKELPANEVADELEEMLDQYTEHMRLHKLKYEIGSIRTLVSIPLGLLEHLTRLRFKSALDALFTLRDQQLALSEAELKAPGRDVAYIVRAQEAFGGGR
jgi:hypothetical protein